MKCLCGMTCFAGQIWPVGRSLETLQEISWTFISWLCMCMHSIFCTVVPQPLIQKSIRDNVAAPFHQSLSQRSEWLTRKSRCRFRKQDILNLYAIAVCRWTLHIDSFFLPGRSQLQPLTVITECSFELHDFEFGAFVVQYDSQQSQQTSEKNVIELYSLPQQTTGKSRCSDAWKLLHASVITTAWKAQLHGLLKMSPTPELEHFRIDILSSFWTLFCGNSLSALDN